MIKIIITVKEAKDDMYVDVTKVDDARTYLEFALSKDIIHDIDISLTKRLKVCNSNNVESIACS